MEYPLELKFKILALAPQLSIRDASGGLVFYVKQKLFKLKEEVTVFSDESQTNEMYSINADRILDFSARYNFTDVGGFDLGAVKREGMRSLWKAHYDIFENDAVTMTIREENPWVKVLDGLFGEIPFIGALSGYVFHPAFLVTRADGTVVMRLQKQASFFESTFTITKQAELTERDETRVLLSLLMMILLERGRG